MHGRIPTVHKSDVCIHNVSVSVRKRECHICLRSAPAHDSGRFWTQRFSILVQTRERLLAFGRFREIRAAERCDFPIEIVWNDVAIDPKEWLLRREAVCARNCCRIAMYRFVCAPRRARSNEQREDWPDNNIGSSQDAFRSIVDTFCSQRPGAPLRVQAATPRRSHQRVRVVSSHAPRRTKRINNRSKGVLA